MQNLFDHRIQNDKIKQSVESSITGLFPIKNAGKEITIENIQLEDDLSETDFAGQKETKLNRKSWEVPIKGTLVLKDAQTGQVISRQEGAKLGSIPKLTNRLSTIIKGNEYQVSNQFRRKSGVYSRQKKNGVLESEFNLAKGVNFSLTLDPDKKVFYYSIRGGVRKYHLWNILEILEVVPSKIEKVWGKNLAEINKMSARSTEESEVRDLYKKLVKGDPEKDYMKIRSELKEYFNSTEMDGEVNNLTLGKSFDAADGSAILRASEKLLNINKGTEQQDSRDSLAFKQILGPDDLVREYMKGNQKTLESKIKNALRVRDTARDVIPANLLTKPLQSFFTTADLSSTPPQTNPVAMVTNARKTTPMGEGGIQNTHAITSEVRDFDPSHIGFLDGLSTPEGLRVGVNIGLASETEKRGTDVVTQLYDKNGKIVKASPMQTLAMVIGFPDQFEKVNGKPKALRPKVKVLKKHKPDEVPASQVTHWFRSPATLFDFNTNMVPFLANTQGNRGSTAGRMITQALPLDKPEAPLTVTKRDGEKGEAQTYEDLMGEFLLPTLEKETGDRKMGGTVTKVSKDYVHVTGDNGKDYKIGLYNEFPLNQDGYLDTKPNVKKGDKIKATQPLAKNNYTDDKGRLALGSNLTVAYLPYKGNSFEDGATITQSAAKKLSHTTIHKENAYFNPKLTEFNLKKFRAYYPDEITPQEASKLNEKGIIKSGTVVEEGDVIMAYLVKQELDDLDKSLRKVNKALSQPYKKTVIRWENEDEGKVTDVRVIGRNVDVYIKSTHRFKEGDKLCIDEDTEVLTHLGWRKLDHLKGTEFFITLDSDNIVRPQRASKVNVYEVEDEPMYHIESTYVDQLVTLNHRMYVKEHNKIENFRKVKTEFGLLPASDIEGKQVKYKKDSAGWRHIGYRYPKKVRDMYKTCVENTEGLVKFFAWFLPLGTIERDENKVQTFVFRNTNKIPKRNWRAFKQVCLDLKLKVVYIDDKVIKVQSAQMYKYLHPFRDKSYRKVPGFIRTCSKPMLELFLKYFLWAAGPSKRTHPVTYSFTTTSYKLRDDLQEIFLKVGRCADWSVEKKAEDNGGKTLWKVQETTHHATPLVNRNSKKVDERESIVKYTGRVWCPTTENGIIYIRRNGKASWTGNSSRYGDKHIVGKIIPDEEAPHRPNGKPVDIMVNPAGVPGRMNTGQILDSAAGKIAEATGKPYEVKNFDGNIEDATKKVFDDMKALGIEPDEKLRDGKNGEFIKNDIFVGPRNYIKLRHIVDKKQSSWDRGAYDIDEQPSGKGAQKVGTLETYAYLGHGARNLLRDATTVKSQKNEEYFRNLQFGLPPGKPNSPFIYKKLENFIRAAGVDVEKNGNKMQLTPITDKKVLEWSSGKLDDAGMMLQGKNLSPIKGGLFDPEKTGGMSGDRYSHIELPKKLPNPMMETAIKSILDLTNNDYKAFISGKAEYNGKKGIDGLIAQLKDVNVQELLAKTTEELKDAPQSKVNKLNLKVRILKALDEKGLSAEEAYTMGNVLVIPPKFRPIVPLPSGDLIPSDLNQHYRDVAISSKSLKSAIDEGLIDDDDESSYSGELYQTVRALQGLQDPRTFSEKKYRGALKDLGHTKKGLIFGKAWSKRQDLSGRSTISFDSELGLDEVGLPREMTKTIFQPFVIKKLKESGIPAAKALKEVQEDSKLAQQTLQQVIKDHPVVLNRAPSLHKHSVQAFLPKIVDGKEIRINPMITAGYNVDQDGDQQINNVVLFLLDKDLENYYITHSKYNANFWQPRKITNTMSSRSNIKLPYIKGGNYYLVNLEDFPYQEDKLIGEKDDIEFFEAEQFIKVPAYDEINNKLILADVYGWSKHKDKEVWTVNLSNGYQIISDDDPRAVYGINPQTLEMERARPRDAKHLLVPQTDHGSSLCETPTVLTLNGSGKLKDSLPVNKHLGYYLGAMIGDGWVDVVNGKPKGLNIAGIEPNCVAYFKECVTALFKKAPHFGHRVSDSSWGKSEKWVLSSVDLAAQTLPLIGKGAENKHLPPFWFSAPDEFKWGLLSGLLDTDGCISITRGKSKPQLVTSFNSTSLRLVQEIQQLLRTLDVRSKVSFAKKTEAGKDFWLLSISAVDMYKKRNNLSIAHKNNKKCLSEAIINLNANAAMRWDYVPFSKRLAELIKSSVKKFSVKHKSLYVIISRAQKDQKITRSTAKKILDEVTELDQSDPLIVKWKQIVENDQLTWLSVESATNTGKTETGYDLTVPGYETFLSVDGIVLSNTMSVNVPISYEAQEEARGMFPSKILYKHGDNSLIPSLSQDYAFGVSKLSELGKETGKTYSSISEAKKDKLDMTDQFTLDGQKMTIGQWELNKVLPKKYRDYQRVFRGKSIGALLDKLAKNESSETFSKVITHWKDLGAMYSYKWGATLSITDMLADRSYRDNIVNKELPRINKIKDEDQKIKELQSLVEKVNVAQDAYFKDRKNNMFELVEGGALSKSKGGNVRQVLTGPGLIKDVNGRAIPLPIFKSYAEGLSTADYINTMPGVRKGIVDKSINTQETGALNKTLLSVTRRQLIVEEDCETKDGVEYTTDDPNVMDRIAAETIAGVVTRGELVDQNVILNAKSKKVKQLKVRSPLTCDTADGICQQCYGALPSGKFPAPVGMNVGVLEGQALSESATQLSLSSFHCMHKESMIYIRDHHRGYGRLTTFEQLWEDMPAAAELDKDGQEVKPITGFLQVWDKGDWSMVEKIFRHKQHPNTKMVLTRARDGRGVISQDNHPHMVLTGRYSKHLMVQPKEMHPEVSFINKSEFPIKLQSGSRNHHLNKQVIISTLENKGHIPLHFPTLHSQTQQLILKWVLKLFRTSNSKELRLDNLSWLLVQQIVWLYNCLGLENYMEYYPSEKHEAKFQMVIHDKFISSGDKLEPVNVIEEKTDEFVYDMTTETHTLTVNGFYTHNSGGAADGGDTKQSFPRLEQLLKVPQNLTGKATLAPVSGVVTQLSKNDIGGWDVKVGSKSLTIAPGLRPLVEKGDKVKKGDALSSGAQQPQELGKLKSHFDAQKYIVDEISNVYEGGFSKKGIETVVRAISDNAVITDAPEDSGYYRGDKTTSSNLKSLNRVRVAEGLDPINYEQYFKSIDTLNVDNEDWFTRITTNRVKDGLAKGVARMQWGDIAGRDPVPAYLWGEDFGNPKKKGNDKGFY